MRKLVCLIILICSFSFAETVPVMGANVEGAPVDLEGVHAETTSEDSTRSVGIFELYSHEIRTSKYLFSFGWKLLLSAVVNTVYSKLRQLIIGKKYIKI